jgi:hypothetical protein
MNPLLISALISAAVGFGSAWTWQGYRMDSYKLEVTNEKLAIEQSNREQLAHATAAVTAAQDAAKLATDRVQHDAAGAAHASVGMRDALAGAVRTASTDLQACTGQVATLSELLTSSSDLARSIAAEADGWANQAVTLQSAWPK